MTQTLRFICKDICNTINNGNNWKSIRKHVNANMESYFRSWFESIPRTSLKLLLTRDGIQFPSRWVWNGPKESLIHNIIGRERWGWLWKLCHARHWDLLFASSCISYNAWSHLLYNEERSTWWGVEASCQQQFVRELSYKWILQPQPSLQMTTTPPSILTAIQIQCSVSHVETMNQHHSAKLQPDSQSSETVGDNKCFCFKLPNFWNNLWHSNK